MSSVKFISFDESQYDVEVSDGLSVMQAALASNVPGIAAECGGAASCATCHVYVDEAWVSRCGEPGPDENDMLDCVASERKSNSRLSCQIEMTAELDGLVVRTPESQ